MLGPISQRRYQEEICLTSPCWTFYQALLVHLVFLCLEAHLISAAPHSAVLAEVLLHVFRSYEAGTIVDLCSEESSPTAASTEAAAGSIPSPEAYVCELGASCA